MKTIHEKVPDLLECIPKDWQQPLKQIRVLIMHQLWQIFFQLAVGFLEVFGESLVILELYPQATMCPTGLALSLFGACQLTEVASLVLLQDSLVSLSNPSCFSCISSLPALLHRACCFHLHHFQISWIQLHPYRVFLFELFQWFGSWLSQCA